MPVWAIIYPNASSRAPGWIEQTTGVQEWRYVRDETSAGMADAAARRALENAGMRVADLDAIIGASTAMHQAVPCTAALVQREVDAPDGRSACFDVNAKPAATASNT